MRNLFDSWKYIFRNLLMVLPFAVVPAVFLALTLDYEAISQLMQKFFSGGLLDLTFVDYFRAFSLVRIDGLGAIFSVLAYFVSCFGAALLLTYVEKHMRIGKRSLSGVLRGALGLYPSVLLITLVYVALYELWALLLSALLFFVSESTVLALLYVLFFVLFLALSYGLLYVVAVFYLWLPCRQITGFGYYDALLYSYRLLGRVRWRLVLSYLISFAAALVLIGVAAFAPIYVFLLVGLLVFALLFLSFCVRMEVAYFRADKLDREDLIHSYREY